MTKPDFTALIEHLNELNHQLLESNDRQEAAFRATSPDPDAICTRWFSEEDIAAILGAATLHFLGNQTTSKLQDECQRLMAKMAAGALP